MSRQFKCPWCKKMIEEAVYPIEQSFLLSFEEGTVSEDSGPNITGYEVENMCTPCALMLKEHLIELGIEIKEIKT